MLTQLIVTSAATGARRPGKSGRIALAKPPQFHIKNTIRLKGFIGKDAQSQSTATGKSVIVLSLATKSSYKDKKTAQWVARTEWHRIVCFAKPAEYAKGLKKGDYIEVEGELRSSEFDAEVGNGKQKTQVKRRNWEVRASLVKKLARPQHSDTDTESISEEDAA